MGRVRLCGAAVAVLVGAACGGDDVAAPDGGATVAVTTNILGDVVRSVAGDQIEVVTILPVGVNPHDFQASPRQAAAMREADLLVVNGAGFEEGLVDLVDSAASDGVTVFEAIDEVPAADADAHDDEDEDEEEEGSDHGHGDVDPHFFTDPTRMAAVVEAMVGELAALPGVDGGALRGSADRYLAELEALDADIEAALAAVEEPGRVLVTSHEVFGYFADRYGFEVVGTVVPGGTTSGGASAGQLADLVEVIRDHDVPAVFTDTSGSGGLAQTLAAEVGGVEVVELFTESLGEAGSGGETYLAMMRTNAERIAAALA